MCKTTFRLLRQFGKKKFAQVKQKVTKVPWMSFIFRNKNCTRKLTDFKCGEKCINLAANPYWKNDIKEEYLIKPKPQIRLYVEKKTGIQNQ